MYCIRSMIEFNKLLSGITLQRQCQLFRFNHVLEIKIYSYLFVFECNTYIFNSTKYHLCFVHSCTTFIIIVSHWLTVPASHPFSHSPHWPHPKDSTSHIQGVFSSIKVIPTRSLFVLIHYSYTYTTPGNNDIGRGGEQCRGRERESAWVRGMVGRKGA